MDTLHYLLNFIYPFILYTIGFSFKKHKYMKIGSKGYSTQNSRRTQDAWEYAQNKCPIYFLKASNVLSILILFITIISIVMNVDPDKSNNISLLMLCICLIIVFWRIESQLIKINNETK